MIKKAEEINIPPEAPFSNDALDRKSEIELLTNLISTTKQPFVLSVEARWGSGKTTFLKLWKAYLESQRYICLYFNAWENDFVEDPLIAFIGEMEILLNKEFHALSGDTKLNATWENLKRFGVAAIKKSVPLAIQIGTHGLLHAEKVKKAAELLSEEADKIGDIVSEVAKEHLKTFGEEKKSISSFRGHIEKIALELSAGTQRKLPLIIFVDELDRCRPDFALSLLERIKHLFNAPNVMFVLGIDRHQLNESVKAIYGVETNPDGYLRRFIDLAYQLQTPSTNSFVAHLYRNFSFAEFNWGESFGHAFRESFGSYASVFGLSLRVQEQCFSELNIAFRIDQVIRNFPYTVAFFSALKAYKPQSFDQLRDQTLEIDTVLSWMVNLKSREYRDQAEAALLVEFPDGKYAAKRLANIQRITAPGLVQNGDRDSIEDAQRMKQTIDFLRGPRSHITSNILSKLSFSSRFG